MRVLTAAGLSCLLVAGCVLGANKPSKVADGEMYQPGDPTYDEFFKSLYEAQLTLGQAPDREKTARQEVAKAVDAPPTATNDELSAALEKRLDTLAKSGVSVKVSTSGLDGGNPTAKVVKSGTPAGTDADAVTSLESGVGDAAKLLAELRHIKPVLAHLNDELPPLDPKVDTAFRKESSRTRSEIHSNLTDAGKLLPLMVTRENEVDARVVELLRALEKVSPPAVAPTPAPETTPPKKKDKKGVKGTPPKSTTPVAEKPAKPKPETSTEPKPEKPKPEPAAEPKPEPKPAKPKPADFEP
ncbi:MAG TPA: hypothetical protein VH062_29910 [Polyangiaceae bacterium]|nr:hypothetical protein [Polyangiaceae bacterium]